MEQITRIVHSISSFHITIYQVSENGVIMAQKYKKNHNTIQRFFSLTVLIGWPQGRAPTILTVFFTKMLKLTEP